MPRHPSAFHGHARAVNRFVPLLLTACFASCVPRDTEIVQVVRWNDSSWVGCTREEVQSVWGDAYVSNDDAGFELRSYSQTKVRKYRSAPRSTTIADDPFVKQPPEVPVVPGELPPVRGAFVEELPVARFWFDGRGLVTRYWVQPKLARSKDLRPPEVCRSRIGGQEQSSRPPGL